MDTFGQTFWEKEKAKTIESLESVEVLTLKSRAEAANMGDGPEVEEELSVLCWRCRRHSPPLHVGACPHCSHKMQYSHVSFEVLPLVRLVPASDITMEEALDLLQQTPLDEVNMLSGGGHSTAEGESQVLIIEAESLADHFLTRLDESAGQSVVLSRRELVAVPPASVLTARGRIFRNMSAGVRVTSCQHCGELFYAEDYEIQIITKGYCPFCHKSPSRNGTADSILKEPSQSSNNSLSPPTSPTP